jgi:hypothetical protein
MQICEGTNIALINGKYVMLYSVGDFAHSNYKLGVAYSDVLVPASGQKYTKAKLYDHANVWGNLSSAKEGAYLLQTEKASWPHYADAFLNGPGLGNIIQYNGTYYLVFHARCCGQTGTGKGRWVWKCPITINFTWPEMWKWIQPKLSVED